MSDAHYAVILVYSTGHALKAEKVIRALGADCKLIPVPRHLSSDCGVCVRILADNRDAITGALAAAGVDIDSIHEI